MAQGLQHAGACRSHRFELGALQQLRTAGYDPQTKHTPLSLCTTRPNLDWSEREGEGKSKLRFSLSCAGKRGGSKALGPRPGRLPPPPTRLHPLRPVAHGLLCQLAVWPMPALLAGCSITSSQAPHPTHFHRGLMLLACRPGPSPVGPSVPTEGNGQAALGATVNPGWGVEE